MRLLWLWPLLLLPTTIMSQTPLLGQGPMNVLAWTGQLAPILASIQVRNQCLVISVPGDPDYQHHLIVKTDKGVGYTLNADSVLNPSGIPIYQYTIGAWHLASADPAWLDSLSRDFDTSLLSPAPCVASKSASIKLTPNALRSIKQSYLVKDTLEKITGPLLKPLGFKTTSINGPGHQEVAGYDPNQDSVFLDPKIIPSLMHLRYALMHEFGHRYIYLHPAALNRYLPRRFTPTSLYPTLAEYQADFIAHAIAWNSLQKVLTPAQAKIWQFLFETKMPGAVHFAKNLNL